ncbi:hypothetical protein SCUCBS95973_007750 [Sporothrix curviconia]|uniref:Zn(2)-C6 fungal-type domain-containing protein n=1 Tax=Sporothrix curviconia TaxID=1260050 RepID=A0ABP0CIQ5_9PEZI
MDPTPKRTRESTSKVRTGCSTCKARRVKCDEAKPVCRRCAVGSRKCTYTAVQTASPPRNVITVYLPPAPVQRQPALFASDADLDFFHQRIAASLNGQQGSGFWGRLVLQLAHIEPCIRHAVAAVSIVHQDVERSLRHPAGYVTANEAAQRKWTLAAQSLSARIHEQPDAPLVPLVCCLLFTFIEFLRGHNHMAMMHIENGLQILAAHRGSNLSESDRHAIAETIRPVFMRLNVLCSLMNRETPPAYAAGTADKDDDGDGDDDNNYNKAHPHRDLADSEFQLIGLLDTCIRFINQANIKAAAFQIGIEDLLEQVRLQIRLDAWRQRLDQMVEQATQRSTALDQSTLHRLMVHYKVVYIWLRVCATAGEQATDPYVADFDELIRHAEQVIKPNNGSKPTEQDQPPLASLDIHILGPLFYTAMKCRHAATRRRAVALLPLAPRREGIWNAHFAHATAQRVIEFEESLLDENGWPDESVRVHGLPLPDDESRVQTVGESPPSSLRNDDQSIVISPVIPATLEIAFRTKPWGLTGDWLSTDVYIQP